MKRRGVGIKTTPVTIGFLGNDLTLLEQTLQNELNLKSTCSILKSNAKFSKSINTAMERFALLVVLNL